MPEMLRVLASISLLSILTIKCCSCLSFQEINVLPADPKMKTLKACLTSAGVDNKNIIPRSSESEYTELNWQWNTVYGYMQPMAYLVAHTTVDVQKAVICCTSLDIRIVPRSGGHSYVKNGFGDTQSLVVDLAKLNRISTDSSEMTCEIGAGARNGRIYYKLWKKGNFMIPAGICPTVGIAGLAQGGGYGYFSRLFGLTSDNIVELDMVDANGKLLTINNSTNTDLFWALRGGGGGSFGIVTKFKFNMYHEPESIAFANYECSFDQFPLFFYAWQSLITSNLPNNIAALIDLAKSGITMELYIINMKNTKTASSERDVKKLLKRFSFPEATKNSIKLLSYYDFLLSREQYYFTEKLTDLAQLANVTRHLHSGWKKVKSFYVDKIINKKQISTLHSQLKLFVEGSALYIEHFGGAINKFTRSQTAFIHRGKTLYDVQLITLNRNGTELPEATAGMIKFYEQSKSVFNHKESYQNYLDGDIRDSLKRYYGNNLRKLIQIKKRVDPKNVFRHSVSIPVK